MAARKGANRDWVSRLVIVPERRAEKQKTEYANADVKFPSRMLVYLSCLSRVYLWVLSCSI